MTYIDQKKLKGEILLKRIGKFALLFALMVIFQMFIPFIQPTTIYAEEDTLVYVIPIEQGIERGLQRFLERAFDEAEEAQADTIILEINTLGGAVDAAFEIGKLIQREYIPVIAYIKGEAISAGSYISLNADKIYMEPGSHIGGAAVRTISGEEADPKITSVWVSHMRDAARQHGRNEEIAEGMVNPNIVISELTKRGELITLYSEKALEYGIADGIVSSQKELLKELGMEQAAIETVKQTPAEKLARFVTNPLIIPILMIIGLAGIVVELLVPGFGIPGLIGVSSFGLYFFGHFFAGFAGWEVFIFFMVGLFLMIIELFVPGFGIFGVLGIISLGTGIALAGYDTTFGLVSLVIAFVVNIILAVILVKYFGYRGIWNRFILKEEQQKDQGYISHTKDKNLVGKTGKTITKLRPAGIVIIDGKRCDVVSEGDLINANHPIEVVYVEGTRIVVREIVKE